MVLVWLVSSFFFFKFNIFLQQITKIFFFFNIKFILFAVWCKNFFLKKASKNLKDSVIEINFFIFTFPLKGSIIIFVLVLLQVHALESSQNALFEQGYEK